MSFKNIGQIINLFEVIDAIPWQDRKKLLERATIHSDSEWHDLKRETLEHLELDEESDSLILGDFI